MVYKMCEVCAFFANGLEEVEALTVVDLLRRAEISVTTVSIHDRTEVIGAHGIKIQADITASQVHNFQEYKMIFLPGGGEGTQNLEECSLVKTLVCEFDREKKKVAAICAAPRILGKLGILQGKRSTSYPSVTDQLDGAIVTENSVETDGNITTSRGVGTAIDMRLELIRLLRGDERSEDVRKSIVYEK